MSATIEAIYEFIMFGLELTSLAAIAAIPVALLVLAIDRLFRRRLSSRILCWLWVVVAVRLLMPIAPASPLSVQQIWQLLKWESAPQSITSWQERWQAPAKPKSVGEWMAQPSAEALPAVAAPNPVVPDTTWDWEEILVCTLCLLWFGGVVVVLMRALVASWRFSRRLRSLSFVVDQPMIDVIQQVSTSLGVARTPQVKYVPDLSAPALFGILRPTLCLPEDTRDSLSRSELRMIAIHELMHQRRRDGGLAWLLMFVRAIHWFNPIAWLSIQHIEYYRELACDDAVREFTQPQERTNYANLLMRFATQQPACGLGLLGLWFARPVRNLTARIESFTAADKRTTLSNRTTATILVILSLAGLTDVASTQAARNHNLPDSGSLGPTFAWEFTDAQTLRPGEKKAPLQTEIREYDLTAALDKIAETRPHEKNPRQWLLTFRFLPVLKSAKIQTDEKVPNRITLTASPAGHDYFAHLLDEVSRFGTTWQVVVTPSVFRAEHVEKVEGIDWQDAVRFAGPLPADTVEWSASSDQLDSAGLSVSMESISSEFSPYLAIILDEDKMARVLEYFQADPRSNAISTPPKFTLFSGQLATIRDESLRPFVVGVTYLAGEYATAAQPTIEVLPIGAKLDIQAEMIGNETLDLKCRLTLSNIGEVDTATLPVQKVTIQMPKATRRTITVRSQIKHGETLLIAPLAGCGGEDNYYYAISTDWFPDPIDGTK